MTVYYNEVVLGRWLEQTVRSLGVRTVLGTVLQKVDIHDGRINAIELASRYGNVTVKAAGFVDASGDAALTWQAGLPCRVPERVIYGSQQVIVENVDESHQPDPGEIDAMLAARGDEHGLLRRGGLAFFFPGRGTAVLNVTHIEAPLDPVQASQAQFDGRDQADKAIALLRAEFPKAFGEARVRAYGYPGRRQTRWIKGRHQLTTEEVRAGTRFADAVARTAWPIELHDRADGYVWEMFGPDHVHYVPLRAMTPPGADNLVAASLRGRGRRRAVQRAGDGPVRRDGRRRGPRAGPGQDHQRARRRPGQAAPAAGREPGRHAMILTEEEKRMRDGAEPSNWPAGWPSRCARRRRATSSPAPGIGAGTSCPPGT